MSKPKELEKKHLMADGGGAGGGGGAGAGGGAGSGAGAGTGGGAGPGNSSGGGAHGNSSGGGGSAGSGDTGSADSTPSDAPASNFFIGSMVPGKKKKKKKKKKKLKFGDGIYEAILGQRDVSDKHYDRNKLPQIKSKHLIDSPFDYTFKEMDLNDIKPVQSQRVKGLVKSSEKIIIKGEYKPLVVDVNNYLVNGHHRYDAARNLEMDKINVIKVNGTIEELIKYFEEFVSNRKVQEMVNPFKGRTKSPDDYTNTPFTPIEPNKLDAPNLKLNQIDVLKYMIKDDAHGFMLQGLGFDLTGKFNAYTNPHIEKYSSGYKAIQIQGKKLGFDNHKKVSVPSEMKSSVPSSFASGQMSLDFDEPTQDQFLNYPFGFTHSELSGINKFTKFYDWLDTIILTAQSLEKLNKQRMRLKSEISQYVAGDPEAGFNLTGDPKVIEYNQVREKVAVALDVIGNNLPKLAKELYMLKDELKRRYKEGTMQKSQENFSEEWYKDLLDHKILQKTEAIKAQNKQS